jgi:hypothetical protein
VCIKLAPTRREKPAAIEKNAAEEEMSRMVVGGLKACYSISRGSQGITRLAGAALLNAAIIYYHAMQ